MNSKQKPAAINWTNITFLATAHLVGLASLLVVLLGAVPVTGIALLAGFVWAALTIFSLSAGYHRLFSHRAYRAHPVLRGFLLFFGAASFQNSALNWAADHRRHHKHVDSDRDPYDARRGFWHSHLGWILEAAPPAPVTWPVPDLERDRLVSLQHRYYPLWGLLSGFALPALLGFLVGDPLGVLLMAGPIRLMLVYHITFSINSLAHMIGSQPYSDESTARDSLLTALVSMGEGYHNFHHTFPADYRNGPRFYQFDPTKWALSTLSMVGLASQLRRTPERALIRARLRMSEKRVRQRGISPAMEARLAHMRESLEHLLHRWQQLLDERKRARETGLARELRERLEREIREIRQAFKEAYQQWSELLAGAQAHAQPV